MSKSVSKYCILVTPYHVGNVIQFNVTTTTLRSVREAKMRLGKSDRATAVSLTVPGKEFAGIMRENPEVRNRAESAGFYIGRVKVVAGKYNIVWAAHKNPRANSVPG